MLGNLCREMNIKKVVHLSALSVREKHPSKYIQSKFQGEKNIQENFDTSLIYDTTRKETIEFKLPPSLR